jgi:predicted HicB family RNase H-like nuclease
VTQRRGRPPIAGTTLVGRTVRIHPDTDEALREQAVLAGATVNDLVRAALEDYLAAEPTSTP